MGRASSAPVGRAVTSTNGLALRFYAHGLNFMSLPFVISYTVYSGSALDQLRGAPLVCGARAQDELS